MNDFKCKCTRCGVEKYYSSLKKAYMDGWNIGREASCFDCQKLPVEQPELKTQNFYNEVISR